MAKKQDKRASGEARSPHDSKVARKAVNGRSERGGYDKGREPRDPGAEFVKSREALRTSFNSILNDNINDIEWYASHPELLMDAGSISWFRPLGENLNLFQGALDEGGTPSPGMPCVPGIMTFRTTLMPGTAQSNISAVNIAARNIYGDLRSVNAGSKNYDPADYMLYLLAADSMYAWMAWLRRLYKQLNLASMYNKYVGKALVQSEGVDFDDLLANISGFRWYINNIQVRLSALAIPGDLPYNRRHMHLFSNLFADSPNQKGQIYKFVPSGYWMYRETNGPGYLEYFHLDRGRNITFADIRASTEAMLSALLSSEDIGVMSGDTLKYYGPNNLFLMEPLLPEEFVLPIYNPELMDQIHNMSVLGVQLRHANGGNMTITQVTEPSLPTAGALICTPYFTSGYNTAVPNIWSTDLVFNVENPDPDPAQTMILSRLAVRATHSDENNYRLSVFGSEVVENAMVWYFQANGSLTYFDVGANYYSSSGGEFNWVRMVLQMSLVRAFDRHPQKYYFVDNGSTVDLVDSDIDYSNYTTCSPEVLSKLHEAALLSLFRVPIVGTRARQLT